MGEEDSGSISGLNEEEEPNEEKELLNPEPNCP